MAEILRIRMTARGAELARSAEAALTELVGPAPTRDQILAVQRHVLAMPQVEMPPIHRFAPGIYSREIVIPAGTLLIGKEHFFDHISTMVSGEIVVGTEAGLHRLVGYHTWVALKGTKRIGVAVQDTRWITAHAIPDHLQGDVKGCEAYLFEPDPAPLELEQAA